MITAPFNVNPFIFSSQYTTLPDFVHLHDMEYALVNGIKTFPQKGLNGLCSICGKEMIAKCGNFKLHHWAHKYLPDCDSWWEPETQWHRDWKNQFSEAYREVPFTDKHTGEIHRADIHTDKGITIEFQNSPISNEELKSREEFYQNLIWVVNASQFKGSFEFIPIPDPNDSRLAEFDFAGRVLFSKKEILSGESAYLVYGFNHAEFQNLQLSNIHFAFEWKNQHKIWFDSEAAVFFDFGHEFIYWLKRREQLLAPLWYVQVIKKRDFITKYSSSV